MTTEEAKKFFDELFVAFPHLRSYLTSADDPQATFDAWKRMLGRCDAADAQKALERILDGMIEVPTKPWDISVLGIWSRSVIGRVTDDRRKQERLASTASHSNAAARVRKDGKKTNFGQAARLAIAAGMCLSRGEITKARNDEIMGYIYDMQSNRETEPIDIPDDVRAEYDSPTTMCFSRV